MSVKIKNFAFRKYVGKTAPNGARTVGFADLTLVLDTVEVELRDIKCRVNARGEHTLCAPSRRYTNAKGETRTRSAFKFDDSTYGALVAAIFANADVVRALGETADAGELKLTA